MKYAGLIISILVFFTGCQKDEISNSSPGTRNSSLEEAISPLESSADLDVLLNDIGDSRYVLLGEASHGTAEYYTWRAEISKRLIQEKGFNMIAVEGDWPDLYKLNQYISGSNSSASAADVLRQLNRWPTWMWANEEVASLGEWLKTYNQGNAGNQVRFFGMDVYSVWQSMDEVIAFLQERNPAAAQQAEAAYQCMRAYQSDEWGYANATMNDKVNCEEQMQLVYDLVQQVAGENMDEEAFSALQNARVVKNGERYYYTAVRSNSESWNVRDRHMMETVNSLVSQYGDNTKVIIWAHNTHVGDARATDMKNEGMVNIGQLIREEHGDEGVYNVGFSSYQGTVVASSSWGSATQIMDLPAARTGSWEEILHRYSPEDKIVLLNGLKDNSDFTRQIGHRAVGVVYDPTQEQGNYVPSVLPERYNAFIFIDQTEALHPLKDEPLGREVASMRNEVSMVLD
jgi:erythromycin esterase-like protein